MMNIFRHIALILALFTFCSAGAEGHLEVNKTLLKANNRANTLHVDVNSSGPWTAVPVANDDGSSFLILSANGNHLDVRCPANNSSEPRSQKIEVKSDNLIRTITLKQAGLGIEFYADPDIIVFKSDGGKRKVTVFCNNTKEMADGLNWEVLKSPEWLDMVIDRSKVRTNDKDNILQPMKSLEISMICRGLPTASAQAFTGRRGTVVLVSGNQRRAITVEQTGVKDSIRRFAFGADLDDVGEDDDIEVRNLPYDLNGGARVINLSHGGAAQEFGFHLDDIIIEVDGKPAQCVADFTDLLNMHQPEEMVSFKVIRNGNAFNISGLLKAVRKI